MLYLDVGSDVGENVGGTGVGDTVGLSINRKEKFNDDLKQYLLN